MVGQPVNVSNNDVMLSYQYTKLYKTQQTDDKRPFHRHHFDHFDRILDHHDQWTAADNSHLIKNNAFSSHDLAVKSHDLVPKTHDHSLKSHDPFLRSCDLALKLHGLFLKSCDLALRSHDSEVCKFLLRSHNPGLNSHHPVLKFQMISHDLAYYLVSLHEPPV